MNNNTDTQKIIELYFKQPYHHTFNEWFEEFLEITNIDHFDKERGLDFYKFPNNNTIMIYTVEKLDQNTQYICDLLGITNFRNSNNAGYKSYNNQYRKVKDQIMYKQSHLDSLLNTRIMHLFYSGKDIAGMFPKYKIDS